jgi:hypothetical protein
MWNVSNKWVKKILYKGLAQTECDMLQVASGSSRGTRCDSGCHSLVRASFQWVPVLVAASVSGCSEC